MKNSDIFHISAQNKACGYSLEPPRRGGSNEYPQAMFLSRNTKNTLYPCQPQFYYIKVGKEFKIYRRVFVMVSEDVRMTMALCDRVHHGQNYVRGPDGDLKPEQKKTHMLDNDKPDANSNSQGTA